MMDDRERRSIELDLESADEEIRRLAVERLAGLPSEDGLPPLLACLGDPGWRVRKAAVERLSQAPAGWPVDEGLVLALSDGDNPGRRNAAAEALVRRGETALPHVLDATHSEDMDVRKLAVDTLAGIGTAHALDRLLEILDDRDPNVRAAAADALGVIGDASVASALLTVANRRDDDPLVAFSALQALARLEVALPTEDVSGLLETGLLRPAAYAVLGHAEEPDDAAVELLLKGVVERSRSSREAAIEALVRLVGRRDGDSAQRLVERIRGSAEDVTLGDLSQRLGSADLSTRLVLIQFLGILRRGESVVPILRAGGDEALADVAVTVLADFGDVAEQRLDAAWSDLDAEARRLACRVLSRTAGPAGRTRLLGALEESDAPLRAVAAEALGVRRCAEALPALVHRLEAVAVQEDEPDAEEELAALTGALVRLTDDPEDAEGTLHDRAIELLGQRLDGAPEPVRLALATVLGRIGRPSDGDLVAWLLKDPSAGVRRAAVQALARLGGGEAPEPLRLALADESPMVRIAAARALSHGQERRALQDLERLAGDEDPRVRAAALAAVGVRATQAEDAELDEAVELLARALHDDGEVALAAVEALRSLGGAAAAGAARGLLGRDEPELVQAAVSCIAAHGERADVEALVPLVGHPHWLVRSEAVGALSERSLTSTIPAILRRLETEQDDFVRAAILRALGRLEG